MFVRYNFVLYAYKNSYHKGLPPLTHRLGLETAYKNVILSGVRLHKSLLFFINIALVSMTTESIPLRVFSRE